MVKGHQVQMASRTENKDEDVEQQSARLLQSDVASVRRDFKLKLTVLDIIEEGHKAAAVAIASSIVIGLLMGMTLPVDHNIPGMLSCCSVTCSMRTAAALSKASMPWCDACTSSFWEEVCWHEASCNILRRGLSDLQSGTRGQATSWDGPTLRAGGLAGRYSFMPYLGAFASKYARKLCSF